MSDKRFPNCPFCGSDDLIFDPSFPEDENAVECNGCGAWSASERKWKARVRPATLLTWSEPGAHGNVYAGEFTVCSRADGTWSAWCMMAKLLPLAATPGAAKAACERHARRMLGWEV